MPSSDLVHASVSDPARLRALRDLGLLDGPRFPAYDRLVRLAARLLHAPVALISLVDADRQFFLSEQGLAEPWASRRSTPLSHSFCKHVVADRAPLVVADARANPRVAENRAVDELNVIAYAGIPLVAPDGSVLGALCAIDHRPRSWAQDDLLTLSDLAAAVMSEISLQQSQLAALASERRRQTVLMREQHARLEAARAAERTARLYALTATLTQAVTPRQVAEAVTAQSMAALGAYAGMLLTRSADGDTLHLTHAIGHPSDVLATWATVPIDAPLSPAEAARTGEAIWLPSREALVRAYPWLPLAPNSLTEAAATIPLCINGVVVAVMVLSFATPQPFAQGDRTLLLYLAEQCAQALDRAQALGRAREELIERQRAEAALHAQTELYERLLQAQSDLGEAVVMVEGERLVFVNEAATALTGYTREALFAIPSYRSLLAPETRDVVLGRPREATEANDRYHDELTLVHATGRYVEVEIAAIALSAGGSSRWIVLVRDISPRKQAEAERHALDRQLQETQKLESLGLLAGGIAHDFNNMLVSILGNADMAMNDLDATHPARPSVEQLLVASRRAADLTNQLLAYSGRGRFVVGPVDLHGLVQEMTGLLRAAISRTITLETELETSPLQIEADATQLRQVVMNLVINAAEAIRGGDGRIAVRVGHQFVDQAYLAACYLAVDLPPGPYVAVEVADTGSGMDGATLKRIFEPFFSTKKPGRGLGLAAVLGIVRAHGGTLHIRSAPGQGTTVTALFPPSVRQEPALPPCERVKAAPAAPRTTVLVIDDEESVRHVTTRMLGRLGYGVRAVPSGEDGLAICAAQPDVGGVLLDLTMPGLSGEQTFLRLRATYPRLPVVIMSGYSEQEVRSRLGSAAGVGVVQKPFSTAQLQQVLAAVIA